MRKIINFLILLSINSLLIAQGPGMIGSSQSLCYASAPQSLTFIEQPSFGTGPYTWRWQRSNDNGNSWYDISGTTASRASYSPPVLGRTAQFRCRVTDASLSSDVTNNVTITVATELTAGTIGNGQIIYASTSPAPLAQSSPPLGGGGGSYTFQWQSSSDRLSWSNIPGATSIGYAPSTLAEDTWFRRFDSDGICGSTATNTVKITVNPITMFTTEEPASSGVDNFNMGTEFEVLTDGVITKVRLYTHLSEGGDHILRLYKKDGTGNYVMIAGPYTWTLAAGTTGWREYELPSAIPVQSGGFYIVSSTTGNGFYVQSSTGFIPAVTNAYIRYERGLYTDNPSNVPNTPYGDAHYFRDVIFNLFSPGSAGSSQTICYNTVPNALTQTDGPTGGSGVYTYQWQSSADNSIWTNIGGAVSSEYSPPALTTSIYYRRVVTSGNISAPCSSVFVAVNPEFSLAQIHDNITIYNNTSTNLNVEMTGGTSPFTFSFERNGVPQVPVTDYLSGADISTGVLSTNSYIYNLTSVTDANGCNPQSLGSSITVVVSGTYAPSITNKALVIVNEASANYSDYASYIEPYLDNFGIPYDIFNSTSPTGHPVFSNYAVIIFGHKNVYNGTTVQYPVADLAAAVSAGVGLYSFDPNLFNYSIGTFSQTITSTTVNSHELNVVNTTHYITQSHADDVYNIPIDGGEMYSNNYDVITMFTEMPASQSTSLASGTDLVTMTGYGDSMTLLEVSAYGLGRIVKWNGYDWISENYLGPVHGMDDIVWRGVVWAARKPFVMQGMPPMVTMRVDDVDGTGIGVGVMVNFEWINICNEFGLIPWCGTFTLPSENITTFKTILDNNNATASPHAFSYTESIYYNHNDDTGFDPALNTQLASSFYAKNGLKMSKYLLPHYYEIDPAAMEEIQNMGIEFVGTHMALGDDYGSLWLLCGPYRKYRRDLDINGRSSDEVPVYYAGNISSGGYTLFNCVSEIRDDNGYEWTPSNTEITNSVAQGARQLKRSLNSMVLPTLFTHQDQLDIQTNNWRTILGEITTAVSPYAPEYRSMDYAMQYIRAKNDITITNVSDDGAIVNITYTGTGVNDMDTKCYLFTEAGSLISKKLILLPVVGSGTITVAVSK